MPTQNEIDAALKALGGNNAKKLPAENVVRIVLEAAEVARNAPPTVSKPALSVNEMVLAVLKQMVAEGRDLTAGPGVQMKFPGRRNGDKVELVVVNVEQVTKAGEKLIVDYSAVFTWDADKKTGPAIFEAEAVYGEPEKA